MPTLGIIAKLRSGSLANPISVLPALPAYFPQALAEKYSTAGYHVRGDVMKGE